MIKSILYPLRKNKLLFKTDIIFNYQDLQFKEFYLNLLPNPYVSLEDKLNMLENFSEQINWNIKTKEGLNILSMVLVNEFSPHQKKFSKDLEYKLYEESLDNISNYIVGQMIKRDINPVNSFLINNFNINNFDQIVFFGLKNTLKSLMASPFKPANLDIYLTIHEFLYPHEKPTYYTEEVTKPLCAMFALVENDMTDILDIFLSEGLDINFKNEKNENALFYTTSPKMTDYLISKNISNQSEKNTDGLYSKQFIKNRISFLKITEAEINKITGSMNAHFEIPEEELIEKMLSSFGNDNFTNFKKLLNNNPKIYALTHTFTSVSVQEMYENDIISDSATRTKDFTNLDIIQSIMLCIWDNQYKISNSQDKFYSKLLLLLKGKLEKDEKYLNKQNSLGITNSELILVSIFMPFNENSYNSEKDTSLLKVKKLICEKGYVKIPDNSTYRDPKPIPAEYLILFYKALAKLLDSLGNLVFSRYSMAKIRDVLDDKYYSGECRELFEQLYIRIIMKRTATPYDFTPVIKMKSTDLFFNDFIEVWKELLKHMTNYNKRENSKKTRATTNPNYDLTNMSEDQIKAWLKQNENKIIEDPLINKLIQEIPDSVLYDITFNHILENIIIKAKDKCNEPLKMIKSSFNRL